MIDNFQNIKSLVAYSEGGILSKVIEKSEKTDITLFCMAKGTEISDHTSTRQGFVYVLEGRGIFTLAGEKITMQEGVLIKLGQNIVHSLYVQENTSFLLCLIN